jgi:hypothetical protein
MDLFVDVSKYFLELLRKVVIVFKDLLHKLFLVIIVRVTKEVFKYRLELLEGLPLETRGYKYNFTILPSELLKIVLKVSLYLD